MNRFLNCLTALFVAVTMIGCDEIPTDDQLDLPTGGEGYTISARLVETKIDIDGSTLSWSDYDTLYVAKVVKNSANVVGVSTFSIVSESISDDGKSADFIGAALESGYTYIALGCGEDSKGLIRDDSYYTYVDLRMISLDQSEMAVVKSQQFEADTTSASSTLTFSNIFSVFEFDYKLAESSSTRSWTSSREIDQITISSSQCELMQTVGISENWSDGGDVVGFDIRPLWIGDTNGYITTPDDFSVTLSSTPTKIKFYAFCEPYYEGGAQANFLTVKIRTTDGYASSVEVPVTSGDICNGNQYVKEITFSDFTNINDGVAADRAALMALYNHTGGENWSREYDDVIQGWDDETPLEEWSGIRVNDIGRVRRISLGECNLDNNGSEYALPAEIGDLTDLEDLSMECNNLSGKLPAELGNLTKLEYIAFDENNLSGELPDLSALTKLVELGLYKNNLSGAIPSWLGDMPNLLFLVLANNQFSGTVPESLGNIDYSVDDDAILALCYNNLTGDIPASIYEGRLETWYTIKDFIVPQNEGYGFNPGYPVIENAFINLSETSATIPSDGESVITFVIESNTAWRAEIIENDDTEWVGWIEGSSGFGNGTFEFHSNQNNTFAEREIVIEVTGTDCAETATITITQEGGEPYLRAAYDTYYTFDYSANMRELEIYTNCENVTYSCSEDWIIVDQCYKSEYGDICWFTFSVTENQATANREGEIILSGVDAEGNVLASQTISISQYSNGGGVQEYYLNPLDGTIYDLSKSTETCGFEVDTNCNGVTYSCSESWITVEQYTNDEYGRAHYFEFTVTDNETGAKREGAIILSGVDADGNVVATETVLISQSTTDYGVQDYWFDYEGNPERSISAEATTFYVGISSNIDWECSTSSPSVVVSPSSGNGDGTIKVSVAENTTSEELVHEILFTTEFIERILVIHQAAAELTDPAPDSEQAGQLEDLTRVEL